MTEQRKKNSEETKSHGGVTVHMRWCGEPKGHWNKDSHTLINVRTMGSTVCIGVREPMPEEKSQNTSLKNETRTVGH